MADALPPEVSGLLASADPAAREAAWTRFVENHSRLLLHVARSVARDHDAAMDAYAYVLAQLRDGDCRRLRAYAVDGRSKFTTWLVVVARRLCLDHHRQRYGRARDPDGAPGEARTARRRLVDLVVQEIDPARTAEPAERRIDHRLEISERRTSLAYVLQELGPRDRLLLSLRFEEDLSAREIAGLMGFPTPFHVYRRLNTVLAGLRIALEARGIEGAEA